MYRPHYYTHVRMLQCYAKEKRLRGEGMFIKIHLHRGPKGTKYQIIFSRITTVALIPPNVTKRGGCLVYSARVALIFCPFCATRFGVFFNIVMGGGGKVALIFWGDPIGSEALDFPSGADSDFDGVNHYGLFCIGF